MFAPVFAGIVEAVASADADFGLILGQWAAAESDGDVETLMRLLDDDFRGDDASGFVLTKQQWLERHARGGHTDSRSQWHLTAVAVRNGVAVATGTHVASQICGGIETRGDFRVTLVAVDRGGRWHIVNVQLVPHPMARTSRTAAGTRPAPPGGEPPRGRIPPSCDANQRRN
jgi:hypothetical protein